MVQLSILVCSVHTRYKTFLPKIQDQLYSQLDNLSQADKDAVEIIILTDNKQMILGHKRNTMIEIAQGNYIVFVDDDDRIEPNYISELLKATKSGADCIVFKAKVSLDGGEPKICHYSKDIRRDYNHREGYFRIPNHICCVKRDLALQCKFPSVLSGEDTAYSKQLQPLLKTEHKIDAVLYHYDYNSQTTETQNWRNDPNKKAVVDVVILSKADSSDMRAMTQKAIDSCLQGTNGIPINVIVMENGSPAVYRDATTIPKPGDFNYNQFANEAAALGSAEWIMIANNDLIFENGWLHELLQAKHPLVSPHEPNDPRQADILENTEGKITGKHLSGWCFMIKRSLWQDIGKFDTDVTFWCSDDVVIEQAVAQGVYPMLVKNSIVKHIPSTTLKIADPDKQADMKWRNIYIFNTKYNKNKFASHPEYIAWFRANRHNLPAVEVVS